MLDIKFTKKHINQFRKIGVEIVYLFGSQAKGKTHSLSDFDIGIVLEKPEKYKDGALNIYLKLYDIFTDVLPKDYLKKRLEMKEHEFDLVFLQFAPIGLQFEAIKNNKVLYEKDKEKRLQYEEDILKKYLDLKYLYDLSFKNLLERI